MVHHAHVGNAVASPVCGILSAVAYRLRCWNSGDRACIPICADSLGGVQLWFPLAIPQDTGSESALHRRVAAALRQSGAQADHARLVPYNSDAVDAGSVGAGCKTCRWWWKTAGAVAGSVVAGGVTSSGHGQVLLRRRIRTRRRPYPACLQRGGSIVAVMSVSQGWVRPQTSEVKTEHAVVAAMCLGFAATSVLVLVLFCLTTWAERRTTSRLELRSTHRSSLDCSEYRMDWRSVRQMSI